MVQQASNTSGTNCAVGTPGTGYGFSSMGVAMITGLFAVPIGGVGRFYGSGGGVSVNIGNTANKVSLVVARIIFNDSGNDTLRVWYDPILNQPLDAPSAQASLSNYADVINGTTLAWGNNRSFVYDELRIGSEIGWQEQLVFRDGFE